MKLNLFDNQNNPVNKHDCCNGVPNLGDDLDRIKTLHIIVMDQEYS